MYPSSIISVCVVGGGVAGRVSLTPWGTEPRPAAHFYIVECRLRPFLLCLGIIRTNTYDATENV